MLENIPHLIFEVENEELVKTIEEGEIIKVVWGLAPDKAPRPNGFFIHLFSTCWCIIKSNLHHTLMHVQKKHKLGGITNSSFLALIPKEVNPLMFSRFQPISLCNSSCKILTKTMANGLKNILSKIMFDNQGGFMQKHQIIDNIIVF
jgi:hypothetical protein